MVKWYGSIEDNLLLGIERHDRTDAPRPFASRGLDMPSNYPHTATAMCLDSEL